jgi:nudix-type nucleoside diphosphatase (YffH/AdpP family)
LAFAGLPRHGDHMDTTILDQQRVYDGWLSLTRLSVKMPNGAIEERHVEDHGAAVALLPFDPARRTAILISQPRIPVVLAGEPPLLEVVAGRLEPEGSDYTVRKEALEEAGLRLHAIQPVARIWSMPTISTERIHLYLAEYGPEDRVASGGGAADENECISVHELPLATIWAQVLDGQISDAKTLILIQFLRIARPELFA